MRGGDHTNATKRSSRTCTTGTTTPLCCRPSWDHSSRSTSPKGERANKTLLIYGAPFIAFTGPFFCFFPTSQCTYLPLLGQGSGQILGISNFSNISHNPMYVISVDISTRLSSLAVFSSVGVVSGCWLQLMLLLLLRRVVVVLVGVLEGWVPLLVLLFGVAFCRRVRRQ